MAAFLCGNDMNKKTEQSRITYNKIAFEYDTSREGQYTRFHIKELSDIIDLSENDIVLNVAYNRNGDPKRTQAL